MNLNLDDKKSWPIAFDKPLIIAGPCSAESRQQVDQITQALSLNPTVKLLRAGIWKPRTHPDSFEGLGEKALPWLVEAGKKYGIPNFGCSIDSV